MARVDQGSNQQLFQLIRKPIILNNKFIRNLLKGTVCEIYRIIQNALAQAVLTLCTRNKFTITMRRVRTSEHHSGLLKWHCHQVSETVVEI